MSIGSNQKVQDKIHKSANKNLTCQYSVECIAVLRYGEISSIQNNNI